MYKNAHIHSLKDKACFTKMSKLCSNSSYRFKTIPPSPPPPQKKKKKKRERKQKVTWKALKKEGRERENKKSLEKHWRKKAEREKTKSHLKSTEERRQRERKQKVTWKALKKEGRERENKKSLEKHWRKKAERGVGRESTQWSSFMDEKGPSSTRCTNGTVSKSTLGKLQRDWVEDIMMGFFSKHIDTILIWTYLEKSQHKMYWLFQLNKHESYLAPRSWL